MHIQILNERRLDVVGEDAREWLNGQLTCDLRSVAPGSATYGLILSPKGKMVSDVWVLEHPPQEGVDTFSLSLPRDQAEAAFQRLDRFLVMEDVELSFSDETIVSLQGPGAKEAFGELASKSWPVTRLDGEGAEIWLSTEDAKAWVAAMGVTSRVAFSDARIQVGIPALGSDMGENTLPQEVGLHGAVSFSKGCYVGQEPVIMLEHRGKPPKRLVQVGVEGAQTGEALLSQGKKVGWITSVHSSDPVALALVKRKYLEETLTLGETPIKSLRILDDAMPRWRK